MQYLPILLWVALLVYCLVDVAQSDRAGVRALPKPAWVVIVVVLPYAGALAWLVAGRPQRGDDGTHPPASGVPGSRRPAPTAPDDDPEFLAGLARANDRHKRERHDRPPDDEAGPPPADR